MIGVSGYSESEKDRFDRRFETAIKSNDDVLAVQMTSWKSEVYDHFNSPPVIFVEKGIVKYKFVCKTNPTIDPVTRVRHDRSTSNLNRHVERCSSRLAPAGQRINEFAHGSTYSKAELRYLITLWVSSCHRPFAIINDPPLQRILKMLFAKVDIPSPSTVSRDVKEAFTIAKKNVGSILQSYSGKLHIGVDGWTSPNVFSFLGVVVYMVKEGKIRSHILDFIKLSKGHTGQYLANQLSDCLKEYGISNKILGQVLDNASNNDTMLAELETLMEGSHGVHSRIRCICHVFNLAVKAMLSQFSQTKTAAGTDIGEGDFTDDDMDELFDDADVEDNEEPEEDELDLDRESSDQLEIEQLAREVEKTHRLSNAQIKHGKFSVTKITQLTKRIFHSPVLREDLNALCIKHKVPSKQVVRSVPTRWNSVAEMVKRALELRKALDKLVDMDRHNAVAKTRLRRFKLQPDEWELLVQLRPLLVSFLKATERMSQSKVPLLHEVIPLIDTITRTLEKAITDHDLYPAVRASAAKGLAILNKYYSKTDDSIMYRCAMILHPRYKLTYFREAKWPSEWIDAAVSIVREQWEDHYRPRGTTVDQPVSSLSDNDEDDLFADIDNFGKNPTQDALDAWIKSPTIGNAGDPIAWWASMLSSGDPLAPMALDFLSAPAASTDVERAFSRGGLTVTKLRHNLSDESTRAATILHSWGSMGDLIPESEIIRAFADKSKRGKSSSTTTVNVSNNSIDVNDTR